MSNDQFNENTTSQFNKPLEPKKSPSVKIIVVLVSLMLLIGGIIIWYIFKTNSLSTKIKVVEKTKIPSPTPTQIETLQPSPTQTSSLPISTDKKKEKEIIDFIDKFEQSLISRQSKDAEYILSVYTEPKTDKEKSDLEFLKGDDVGWPSEELRMFSSSSTGGNFKVIEYKINKITPIDQNYRVEVSQKVSSYSNAGKIGWGKEVWRNYIFEILKVGNNFKVDKYYWEKVIDKYDSLFNE